MKFKMLLLFVTLEREKRKRNNNNSFFYSKFEVSWPLTLGEEDENIGRPVVVVVVYLSQLESRPIR